MTIGTPVENLAGGAASASVNIVVPSNGSVIFAYVKSNTSAPTGCSSNLQGALAQLQQPSNSSNAFGTLYALNGANAGTHTITATAGGLFIRYLMAFYVTGSTLDVSASNDNTFTGTGANILSAGSLTTNGADLVFELFNDLSGNGATLTVGTVPNTYTQIALPSAAGTAILGYYQQTVAGIIAPTGGITISSDTIGFAFSAQPTAVILPGVSATGGGGGGGGRELNALFRTAPDIAHFEGRTTGTILNDMGLTPSPAAISLPRESGDDDFFLLF